MNLHDYLYNELNKELFIKNNNKTKVRVYPHQSSGEIVYSPSTEKICDPSWVLLKCDEDIVNYYKWFLLKKGVKLDALMWGSHISIIRGEAFDKIDEKHMEKWKFNDGESLGFKYGDLVTNGVHWWLDVQSEAIEQMRSEFGLKPHPDFGFHITIGKIKQFK